MKIKQLYMCGILLDILIVAYLEYINSKYWYEHKLHLIVNTLMFTVRFLIFKLVFIITVYLNLALYLFLLVLTLILYIFKGMHILTMIKYLLIDSSEKIVEKYAEHKSKYIDPELNYCDGINMRYLGGFITFQENHRSFIKETDIKVFLTLSFIHSILNVLGILLLFMIPISYYIISKFT